MDEPLYGRRGPRSILGHAWERTADGRLVALCDPNLTATQGKGFCVHEVFQPPGISGCAECRIELKKRGLTPDLTPSAPSPQAEATAPAPAAAPEPSPPEPTDDHPVDLGSCGTCHLLTVRTGGQILHEVADADDNSTFQLKGRGGCKMPRPNANPAHVPVLDEAGNRIVKAKAKGYSVTEVRFPRRIEPTLRARLRIGWEEPLPGRWNGVPLFLHDEDRTVVGERPPHPSRLSVPAPRAPDPAPPATRLPEPQPPAIPQPADVLQQEPSTLMRMLLDTEPMRELARRGYTFKMWEPGREPTEPRSPQPITVSGLYRAEIIILAPNEEAARFRLKSLADGARGVLASLKPLHALVHDP